MDTISLAKIGHSEKEAAITFLINGRDLIDIILDHDGIALGLPLHLVAQERHVTVFREGSSSPVPERLVVLACERGWSGVTAVTVMVRWSGNTIFWSEFAPAWRGRKTRVPQIGPFAFEPKQYEDVIVIGRRLSDDWRVHHERAIAGRTA